MVNRVLPASKTRRRAALRVTTWFFAMFLALGPIFVTPANAVTVSTPTYTSIIGGSGGSDDASPLDCGSSKVVVEVRTGGTNDSAFAIVCATLNADGTVGTKDSTAIFSRFGSGASHNFISECPSGQAMVAIQTSRNTWLGAAQVECAEPPTGTAKTLGSITSTRTWNWGSGTCNAGEFVSAIRTRTGGSVDGIYLGCSTISNFGVAPATVSSGSPSGSLIEGSTLTSEVSFSGVPAPTLTYVWEFSQDGSSGWNAIAGATSSTFTLTTNEVGGYLRTVVTATNSSGTLAATSSATGQVMAPAPAPTPTPSTPPPPPPPTAGEAAAAGEDALENAADYFTANNIDLSNYSQNALVIEWNWLTQQYAQAISEGRNSRAMTYASSMNSKLRQIVAAYEAGTLAQNPSPTPAPEPVAPEPEPEPVAPEPVAPEPVAPEPEPELVAPEPEPELVAPEPVASEPAPEPEAPAPAEPNPEPQPNTPEPVQPAPEPELTPEVNSEPKPTPAPTPTPTPTATPTDNTPPATTAPSEPEAPVAAPPPSSETGFFADPGAFLAESFTAAAELLAELLLIEIPVVGEPVENLAIGASGDDSVIVEFDPVGTPEAVEATNKLLAATGAIAGVAAAAGAAAAAAAAAGAAGAAASAAGAAGAASSAAGAAGSAGAAGATGAEMSEDAMDSLAEAGFDLDAFTGEPPGRGDNLGAWSLAALVFLDKPTKNWTKRTARFSPLLSKLLNDGIYLRAMLGSISVLPLMAAVVFAVLGLQENAGTLLHPPVPLFLAIGLIGLFDSFAGVVGISVFILGSLPLVDPTSLEDWRMLAGTAVAGFGPILIARSIRNFRRRPIPGVDGLFARIGDIAFASLMGGWVAGLVFRALPALTGLTVPAANYVATFQMLATIAIAFRIVLEDLAARNFPHRMDALAPDVVPEPPRAQVVTSLVLKYLLYVFIASAFMGLGLVVWIAAAMFMVPTLLDFVKDRLPVSSTLWRWLPVGLPGLAMILGLEILLENALSVPFGENDNFSIIFIFSLISMLIVLSLLGALGRSGRPGEQRLFERPSMRWIARLGGLVTFLLLIQFTSML